MTTTRLKLYNQALIACEERPISSLGDETESRRILDYIWDSGAVNHCLEQGYWNFAIRSMLIDYTSEIEPDFGYSRAFEKPSDWLRTYAICYDEYFKSPINEYSDEVGYWWSDAEEMYVQYVSSDASYGMNYAEWPESFTRYVELYLAYHASPRLTMSSAKQDALEKRMKLALRDAKNHDMTNQPAKKQPLGSWVRARIGNKINDSQRGDLIG